MCWSSLEKEPRPFHTGQMMKVAAKSRKWSFVSDRCSGYKTILASLDRHACKRRT